MTGWRLMLLLPVTGDLAVVIVEPALIVRLLRIRGPIPVLRVAILCVHRARAHQYRHNDRRDVIKGSDHGWLQ